MYRALYHYIVCSVCCLTLIAGNTVQAKTKKEEPLQVQIVFIGNSISAGAQIRDAATYAPPVRTGEHLKAMEGIGDVIISNQAVSGKTTADFLPSYNTMYPRITQAADKLTAENKNYKLVFSVMLGTNDSAIKGPTGSPIAPKQYHANLELIIDRLIARYPQCIIVLHRPIWYSPNTYNNGATYLQEGLNRLQNYYPELQALVSEYAESHPGHVFMGDESAFDFFRDNAETHFTHERGNAGTFYLHPNQTGADILGKYWADALYAVLTAPRP